MKTVLQMDASIGKYFALSMETDGKSFLSDRYFDCNLPLIDDVIDLSKKNRIFLSVRSCHYTIFLSVT